MPLTVARRAWTLFEPIHAIVYFVPEVGEHYKAAGLRGGWMGYFASRSAPMGAVTAPVVTAIFHNFRPAMVERAIPDAWGFATPERVLTARHAIADAALRRLWSDEIDSADMEEAATSTMAIARELRGDGRPLFAAHAALAVPDAPHLALWHACTLLREHRFEGHVAALTAHGIDGLQALVIRVAARSGLDAATIRPFRGWTDDEWEGAERRLRDRGVLDGEQSLTAEGVALRAGVEDATDRLAGGVWDELDPSRRERLFGLLRRFAVLLEDPQGIQYPNPVGVPRPG